MLSNLKLYGGLAALLALGSGLLYVWHLKGQRDSLSLRLSQTEARLELAEESVSRLERQAALSRLADNERAERLNQSEKTSNDAQDAIQTACLFGDLPPDLFGRLCSQPAFDP
jgi:hypothetical protein